MIKRPGSKIVGEYEVITDDDPAHFLDMSEDKQSRAMFWIRANIYPGKTVWKEKGSYGMKHILENECKIYMTNNQYKEAMLRCGFFPTNKKDLNWYYRVDRKSPICLKYREEW